MTLPSISKVKEAKAHLIKANDSGYVYDFSNKTLKVLLSLAQAYISAPVVEEKIEVRGTQHDEFYHTVDNPEARAFNEALRLCRLNWMKKTSVEKIVELIKPMEISFYPRRKDNDKTYFTVSDAGARVLAQAIHKMLNGGGE